MPVSGHEETGFKSYAGHFSGLIAGVPIKKRRFPLIPSFSPLSGEQCSQTEEAESLQKEHSCTSQGSTLPNVSIADAPIKKRRFPSIQSSPSPFEEPSSPPEENYASRKEHSSTSQGSTSSSGLSDTNRSPAFEERKASSDITDANLVQSNSSYLSPKLEEPNVATHSSTLDVVDSKKKLITTESHEEKLGSQMMKENSELLLAAKESLALNIGADITEQNVEEKCKQESSANLSLGLKQLLLPPVASRDIDESFQKTEKAESVSLRLSLSKEEGSSKSCNSDAKTNRANWDLNTTMDAWEEAGNDAASGKTSTHGLQITGSALNEKLVCSSGLEPTGSASLKQTNTESQDKAFSISSRLYGEQYNCVDPLNICLASRLQKYTGEPSRLSVKQNSDSAVPRLSFSNVAVSAGDVNLANVRRVKSEPLDENPKRDSKEAKPSPGGSLDGVTVKHELVERPCIESSKSSTSSNLKLFDPKFVKSEPGHESNQDRPKTTESKSHQMGRELPQGSDNCSAVEKPTLETMPISAETACPQVKAICSAELSTSGSIVNHLENHARVDKKTCQGACSGDEQVPPESVSIAMVDNATESSGPAMKDSIRTKEENADDSGEGCVSDDEKITLSADMLEDDSYCFDYESDDTHSLTVPMDIELDDEEDDDYEDGEVREPLEHSVVGDSVCEVREVERIACSNDDRKQTEKRVVNGDCPTSSHAEENDHRTVTLSETNCGKDGIDNESNKKSENVTDKIICLKESLEAEKPTVYLQTMSLDHSERKNVFKSSETELLSDQGTNESHEVDVAQCADEVVKNLDMVRKTDSDLPMEVSVNTDDAPKDVSNSGNQGRIINLSRAASSSSPTKSRSISGRGLPSRAGRDVFSDAFDHDKVHGGRDEVYIEGPRKFSRDRHQDMSPRNSRLNFVRGRGRMNSRLDTHRGEWESDREFAGEFYNGPSQFRGPRHKFAPAVHDADLEFNDIGHDSSYVTNRVGRKPLNDEGPLCRHITSRRRSPGGREGLQMGHRIPRTMSPGRCVGDDSELVGMRHSEKFMRGFREDALDTMFTRPQPFERLDGRFPRGSRNFSIQRRAPPRSHSKSPIRSRSRSPGPWSSPRRRSPRRSPDGFGGHPEMVHRRSPLYRVDRMRSPDRPVFTGERVVRRHVSPPYMSRPSNDIRDINSGRGRGRGHPRSVISNRSPSGRILLRNRRFDVVDPQSRADTDEYFGGPMHTGRLLELNGEGSGDDRRRFGERRGPVRSFRPPYNNDVGENFHLDAENGPRHYRFCTDDSEFHERGSFDRRIKSRPANVPPRRTRNIDEQEANYRNNGQVWTDDGFDDISRVKRKRF